MYTDLMLDLETVSTRNNAAIVSIGYQFFNPTTEEFGPNKEIVIDTTYAVEPEFNPGYHVCARTMNWWSKQGAEAKRIFEDVNNVSISYGLELLIDEILDHSEANDLLVWGNGSTFDITILKNAFLLSHDSEPPWQHENVRDVRTLVAIGRLFGIDPKVDIEFTGVKHNAADDAKHQAVYCTAIHQLLLAKAN
ncbi:3'-5' exonuclease [Glaciecola sp. 2405UD65-10]|uniref:3'-5' exonuclease n=1 Tax=Glaciecola sp. 2405UD65-10 TaxID=3397244 RepID=UPI003B5BBDDA